jgi:hypothetical protein
MNNSQIESIFSKPRLEKYKRPNEKDYQMALKRYFWNIEISSTFFLYLSLAEVCLRNRIEKTFLEVYGENWWDSSSFNSRIHWKAADKINSAKDELVRNKQNYNSGDLVAKLNLGFWVSLFNKNNFKVLVTEKKLTETFPSLNQKMDRKDLFDILDKVRFLRNRIFHHEPIWHYRDLSDHKERIEWVIRRLGGLGIDQVKDLYCRYDDVIKKRP